MTLVECSVGGKGSTKNNYFLNILTIGHIKNMIGNLFKEICLNVSRSASLELSTVEYIVICLREVRCYLEFTF